MSIILPTTVDRPLASESDNNRLSEEDVFSPLRPDYAAATGADGDHYPLLGQALETNHAMQDQDLLAEDDVKAGDVYSKLDRQHRARLPNGIGFYVVRWPLLIIIFLIISFQLTLYFLIRQWVTFQEYAFVWRGKKRRLRLALEESKTFEEWRDAALLLDLHMKKDQWKRQPISAFYDHRLIQRMNRLMSSHRKGLDADDRNPVLMRRLKRILGDGAVKSNLGGVENVLLYSKTYHGTKQVVEEYVQEVIECLRKVYDSPLLSLEDKFKFFKKADKAYGRSALCLSGGATFGYFHLGVIKALLEYDRLPSVISGTSAGSLIASFVCVRTDAELKRDLTPEIYRRLTPFEGTWTGFFRNIWKYGSVCDPIRWREKMQWMTMGHTTFSEAYKKTGRILNVTVVSESEHSPPKLLNYKTAPDIVIWSAVLASSAVPGLLPPMELMRKLPDGQVVPYREEGRRWRDGSLLVDIPLTSLHQLFRVNYTIVSQVNPHVICFFFESRGSSGHPTAHRGGEGWRGGFLASTLECSIKMDLKKWLRILRDMQLLPFVLSQDWSNVWLQKFDGSITIIPSVSFSDYVRLLTDPTRDRMVRYIRQGEHAAWAKLHMIGNRLKIEHCIQRCREHLEVEMARRQPSDYSGGY